MNELQFFFVSEDGGRGVYINPRMVVAVWRHPVREGETMIKTVGDNGENEFHVYEPIEDVVDQLHKGEIA